MTDFQLDHLDTQRDSQTHHSCDFNPHPIGMKLCKTLARGFVKTFKIYMKIGSLGQDMILILFFQGCRNSFQHLQS